MSKRSDKLLLLDILDSIHKIFINEQLSDFEEAIKELITQIEK